MSDYFENLLVRSFRPMTAVRPLETPSLMLPADDPDLLAPPALEEFTDPFAQPVISGDQSTEELENSLPHSDRSPHKEKQLRRLVKVDEAPIEAPPAVSSQPVTTAAPSVEFTTKLESDAPSSKDIPHSSDKPLPGPRRVATSKPVKPLTGKSLRPSVDEPPESPRPALTTPGDEIIPKVFLPPPVNRLAEQSSAPRIISSAEQPERAPREKVSAAEQVSPHLQRASSAAPDQLPLPQSVIKRVVVQQIPEPVEKAQSAPAPPAALVPKPSEERTLPPTLKTRPNLMQPSSPNAAAVEVSPPDTIINVTIGRIEVRATPAQASTPERHSNVPRVMSLDDYLRQRSGGRL